MPVIICAAALGAFAASHDAGAPRRLWSLTPEARKIVAEMRESAAGYRPHTDHIGLFSRAQLKYGAQRKDFIHRWYDRPLHQDSTWADTMDPRRLLHPEAWKKTAEAVRLGKMDGLAFCPSLHRSDEAIPLSATPGGEMTLLFELPYAYADTGLEAHLKTAERALATPNAYRIDGKVVLTRYPPVYEDGLDFPKRLRAALDERFGPGKFAVVFYVSAFERQFRGEGTLTAEKLEWGREHLRRCLRAMDGVFVDSWEVYKTSRYDAALEREVLIPLYQSVLSEPEFRGRKVFGISIMAGHENCYRWNYDIDSHGTRTVVSRMESMLALRPDFVICCEWDEENENTFFRPTVANGYVHQRVLRCFADAYAGRTPTPMPGDDTSVPNLVVSYRRSLVAGEPIEVEVRNIPDGTFRGMAFTFAFRWKSRDGRVVKSYPPTRLDADSPGNAFFVSPASELVAANRVLLPEMAVATPDGRKLLFGSDFWPLDLNAVRAVDAKWVKHALRERTRGIRGAITASRPGKDGTVTVSGSFSADDPVRSVEVLEGPDTVFMFDPSAVTRKDQVVLKMTFQARGSAPRSLALKGTVRIENAPGLEIIGEYSRGRSALADGWRFRNATYSNWDVNLYAAVPLTALDKAEIVGELPPTFPSFRIKVRDVVEKEVVGVSGPAGGNFVARRFLSQIEMPKPCMAREGEFSFAMKPPCGSDVLRMQIIDGHGNVWRGSPLVLERPAGKLRKFHVFERDEGRVSELAVDACRAEEPEYRFDQTRGSVVWTESGRHLSGILAGPATLVTGIGQGESCYGDTLARYLKGDAPDILDNAPKAAKGPDGGPALLFDGTDYLMLPQQLAPRFSGFEIEVDVCPDSLYGVQSLVDAGNAAYRFFLRDGVPEAEMWGVPQNPRGPSRLKTGEWSRVRLAFDQSALTVYVDGRPGEPVPFSGCQYQARYTAVGGANRLVNFFRGRLANLRFRLR